jgi:hypothetical protein
MDPVNLVEKAIEIRCQDKFGNVVDEFKLDKPLGQDQVRIEGSKLFVAEDYSETIVVVVIPRGDKFEKKQIEFRLEDVKEDAFTVVLEPVRYKVVFRIGIAEFDATETMNPSEVRTKWGTYDYEINNTNRTIYIRVHGKPVEKVKNEPIHTVVERRSVFRSHGRRSSGNRKWLLLLLLLLLGYGIYACVSKYVYEKTPWPFKAKTVSQFDGSFDDQFEDPVDNQGEAPAEAESLAEEQATAPQGDEEPATVAPEAVKVADSDHQHDIDYLKREKKWNVDSLRTPEYRALFDALREGNVDQVIQLKDALFDSVNIQNDFKKVVDGLSKFKANDDQKKLSTSKSEMKRLSKNGSFEIGELSYCIYLIDKRN